MTIKLTTILILMVVWLGSLMSQDTRPLWGVAEGKSNRVTHCRPTAITFILPTLLGSEKRELGICVDAYLRQVKLADGTLRPLSAAIWDDDNELGESIIWGYIRHNMDVWMETEERQYLDNANKALKCLGSRPMPRLFINKPTQQEIEREAYFQWERTGGSDEDNWRAAEDKFKVNFRVFNVYKQIGESA